MRKRSAALLAVILLACTLLLSGCGSRPLPDGMEEDAVAQTAGEILDLLTAGDYQAVADRFRGDVKEEHQVTADTVKAAMDTVAEAGAYVRTTDTLVVGGDRKKFDEPYGVAVLYCEHESSDVMYELSFDTGLDLIGLAVKKK